MQAVDRLCITDQVLPLISQDEHVHIRVAFPEPAEPLGAEFQEQLAARTRAAAAKLAEEEAMAVPL